MRVQLNFIRGRIMSSRAKASRRLILISLLSGFLLSVIWMGYVYVYRDSELRDYRAQLDLISKRYDALNEEVFEIAEYKKDWDFLHHRISLSSDLRGKQIWWTPKLEALSELIPRNIWINTISVEKTTQRVRSNSSSVTGAVPPETHSSVVLVLQGFALPGNNEGLRSIENFAQELTENPIFRRIIREVNLTTATRTEATKDKVPVMSFRLSCQLVAEERL